MKCSFHMYLQYNSSPSPSSPPSSSSIEQYVILKSFDDYGVTYELIAYTNKPNEYQKLQSEIRKNIYDTFQKHGLNLTFPQAQIDIVKNNLDSKAKNLQQ
jgi:small-conductance mechanosensitive channel